MLHIDLIVIKMIMQRHSKKADLSLNTIVIAAITLIVLVVIVLIFTGRINIFSNGLQDCINKGGEVEEAGTSCGADRADLGTFKENGQPKKCCLPVMKQVS
jgi:hypothetical protein